MLVYLLFIFACGWCVCWLLFLNYQQHSRDNQRAQQRRKRRRRQHSKRPTDTCRRSTTIKCADGRRSDELELELEDDCASGDDDDEQQLELRDFDDDGEDEFLGRAECCRPLPATADLESGAPTSQMKVDSVINLYSEHSLLLPQVEGGEESGEACKCVDCQCELLQLKQRRQAPLEAGQLLCGWPEAEQASGPIEQEEDEENEGNLVDLQPLVELHENPLGEFEEAPSDLSGSQQDIGAQEARLARSRLLSLNEHQLERRAAIRMISSDSVQLLVQQQQQQQQQETRQEDEEAVANVAQAGVEGRPGALERPAGRNDLLMVMQQQQQQQTITMQNNNDTRRCSPAVVSSGSASFRSSNSSLSQAAAATPLAGLAPSASSTPPPPRPLKSDKSRQLEQVEKAISLHLLRSAAGGHSQQQAGGRLPTLAQVQTQMEAAKAHLRAQDATAVAMAVLATQQAAAAAVAQAERADQRQQQPCERQPAGRHGNAASSERRDNKNNATAAPPLARSSFADPPEWQTHLPQAQRESADSKCPNAQSDLLSKLDRHLAPPPPPPLQQAAETSTRQVHSSIACTKSDELAPRAACSLAEQAAANRSSGTNFQHQQDTNRPKQTLNCDVTSSCGAQLDPAGPTDPIPTPRNSQQQQQQQPQHLETLATPTSKLTILTSPPPSASMLAAHPRIRDLCTTESGAELMMSPASSSCQSTPTNCSLLSSADSTLTSSATSQLMAQLSASGGLNSSELVPKLIERLDRKLVVMKREQLALMREIEANERAGQRLFEAMRERLALGELDKLCLHAGEIEKVTKLILSLKLRLKRIELELKEKAAAPPPPPEDHQSCLESAQETRSPSSSLELQDQLTSENQQHEQQTSRNTNFFLQQQAQLNNNNNNNNKSNSRNLSDPTNQTAALPKRNHQHHASLHAGAEQTSGEQQQQAGAVRSPAAQQTHLEARQHQTGQQASHLKASQAASSSSDSIFNSADSAIGGSCTLASDSSCSAHGGSSTNLTTARKNADHLSSRRDHSHQAARRSHLSSSISVSSHSSMASSVPSSPSLMSPTATNSSAPTGNDQQGREDKLASELAKQTDGNNNPASKPATCCGVKQQQQQLDLTSDSLMAMNLVTELEVLEAKRNKLRAQLEEAAQLEECIVKRQASLVERILKKHYREDELEIEDFKQFTKLKALLLRDSHDIADRIDNAELQLSELKHQTSVGF